MKKTNSILFAPLILLNIIWVWSVYLFYGFFNVKASMNPFGDFISSSVKEKAGIVIILLSGSIIGFILTRMLYRLEIRINEKQLNGTLRFIATDTLLLIILCSRFFTDYKKTIYFTLSDDPKVWNLFAFLNSLTVILFLYFFYLNRLRKIHEEEFLHRTEKIKKENLELTKKILTEKQLLSSWKQEVSDFNHKLSDIPNVPPEILKYYSEILDSFKILEKTEVPKDDM